MYCDGSIKCQLSEALMFSAMTIHNLASE